MTHPMQVTDEMVRVAAEAMRDASCPGREGPYGLYDYSAYSREKPHRVLDFRDPSSKLYGGTVFQSDDPETAQREFERLTDEHIVKSMLAAALAAMWQPIETAPKNGTRFNLCWEATSGLSEHVELGKWKASVGWCNTYGHPFHGDPTHWMPLPPAPSQLSKRDDAAKTAEG